MVTKIFYLEISQKEKSDSMILKHPEQGSIVSHSHFKNNRKIFSKHKWVNIGGMVFVF
jgi:hypothetical protein